MSIEQFVVTDRALEKGVNPGRKGYQVAAKSPGIPLETCEKMTQTFADLGAAISRSTPQAKDALEKWMLSLTHQENVPAGILGQFPVVWRYAQVTGDLFALSRVCYAQWTHDGRLPNFLAHTLVFPPESLVEFGYNPMALSRTNLFWLADKREERTLPAMDEFKASVPSRSFDCTALAKSPYANKLPEMLSVLCHAGPVIPSLHICLERRDDKDAEQLLESLLDLLPRKVRCRTTFLTLSEKPVRAPSGQESQESLPYQILMSPGESLRSLGLSAVHYGRDARQMIFNFVEKRFAESGQVKPCASFIVEAVAENHADRIERLHSLVEKIGLEDNRNTWNDLVPLARCEGKPSDREHLAKALPPLSRVLAGPGSGSAAVNLLEIILPSITALAEAADERALSAISRDVSSLVNPVSGGKEGDSCSHFLEELGKLCLAALRKGHALTASALLDFCGETRRLKVLYKVLQDIFQPSETAPAKDRLAESSSDGRDKKRMIDLLVEGLAITIKGQPSPPWHGALMIALFSLAAREHGAAEVWKRVGESRVIPYFSANMDEVRKQVLIKLIEQFPEKDLPDPYLELSLRRLKAIGIKDEEMTRQLTQMAHAMCSCSDRMIGKVLSGLEDAFLEKTKTRICAFGIIFGAASKLSVRNAIYKMYQDLLQRKGKTDPMAIRCWLASADCHALLCRDLSDEFVRWDDAIAADRLRTWIDTVFKKYPKVLGGILGEMARNVESEAHRDPMAQSERIDGDLEFLLPLMKKLLDLSAKEPHADSGRKALYTALLTVLPIRRLSDADMSNFREKAPPDLEAPAQACLETAKFLVPLEQRSRSSKDWSVEQFSKTDSTNLKRLRSLPPSQRRQVLREIVGTFANSGVKHTAQAEGLYAMFRDAYEHALEPTHVVDALQQLIEPRDPVTKVNAAMAFIQPVLDGAPQKDDRTWMEIIRLLAESFDKKETYGLLGRHLKHHSCRADKDYSLAREQLMEDLGFQRARPARPEPPVEKPHLDAEPQKQSFFGRLLGRGSREEDDRPRRNDAGPSGGPPKPDRNQGGQGPGKKH